METAEPENQKSGKKRATGPVNAPLANQSELDRRGESLP
jgi:hypothetical protein